jgi:hypothetical protein
MRFFLIVFCVTVQSQETHFGKEPPRAIAVMGAECMDCMRTVSMKNSEGGKPFHHSLFFFAMFAGFCSMMLHACAGPRSRAPLFPGDSWARYDSPEEAGWSSEKLAEVKAFYDEIGSSAFLVVFNGSVLLACGEIDRRYMCHSVRKSFLSALYGIYVSKGRISLDNTLADLDVDDEPPLTNEEKQARVIDLLQARSGVFHAAAYETPKMKERRPARGSKKPGEFWYYNNWDFNALCTIFEQEIKEGIFEEFKTSIADPLGMEDFRLMDTYYHLEKQHSIHPAYPFRMSARDLARFGLLFLRNGKWKERQIVPKAWVEASQRAYSQVPDWRGYGYGYMWWVNIDERDRKYGMYAALGYGGHMIAVLPEQNLVVVNRANTYLGEETEKDALLKLIDLVLDAKVSPEKAEPHLVQLDIHSTMIAEKLDSSVQLERYTGSFEFDDESVVRNTIPYVIGDMIGRNVRIEVLANHLKMTDNFGQQFILTPRSVVEFFIEDMDIPLLFELDDQARPVRITLDASPAWRISGKRINGEDIDPSFLKRCEQVTID